MNCRWHMFLLLLAVYLYPMHVAAMQEQSKRLSSYPADSIKKENIPEPTNNPVHNNFLGKIAGGERDLQKAKQKNDVKGIITSLNHLASAYAHNSEEGKAMDLYFQSLDWSRKTNNPKAESHALLNLGVLYMRMGGYPQALKYFVETMEVSEKVPDYDRKANILFNIAKIYQLQNDLPKTEATLQKAIALEDQREKKNYSHLCMFHTKLGFIYKEDSLSFSNALHHFNLALQYAKKIPSEHNAHAIAMTLVNLGRLYQNRSNFKKALYYNSLTFQMARKYQNTSLEALGYQNIGYIYKSMGRLQQSNEKYRMAKNLYAKSGLKDKMATIENYLAENFVSLQQYDSAEIHAVEALKIANKSSFPELSRKALSQLVDIASRQHQFEKALQYQQQYQQINDTLLNKEKNAQIARLQVLFDTQQKQRQIQFLQLEAGRRNMLLYLVIVGCILLLLIGALLFRQQKIKRQKDALLHASRHKLINTELTHTRLHEQQLQQEVQSKNKELTTYALNFIRKNQLLDSLKEKIAAMRKGAGENIAKNLNHLQQSIRHSFSLDEDWEEFKIHFEQVHDAFYKELKNQFPELSAKELRLCALLKLNLNTKEMATILGISPSSVKMARYRLRKKLNLDSDVDLAAYLITFESKTSGSARVDA